VPISASVVRLCSDCTKIGNIADSPVLAAWKTPHAFALLSVSAEDAAQPPRDVVTYGPIATDLIALAEPILDTVTRLGRTLGFEWLVSLVTTDRLQGLPEPALASYLHKQFALRPGVQANPYRFVRGRLRRPRPDPLPIDLLTTFVAEEHGRLTDIGNGIHDLCWPLLEVAKGADWDVTWQPERAAIRFNALRPSLKLSRVTGPVGTEHLLTATDLYTRALLEIVAIYDQRPPLAICRRCDRLFIPERSQERHCRRFIWDARSGELVATCTPALTTLADTKFTAAVRRREYKKHQMRVRRLRERLGADHPNTQKAQDEFMRWRKDNPAPVGRPKTPLPIDYMLDPVDSETGPS
jgi:hypothetical protein